MTYEVLTPSALKLDRNRSLIVVMDVQERLVAAMPDEYRGAAIDNVIRLVQGARLLGIPLLFTEQYPQGLGETIEPVAQALKELNPAPSPIQKVEFDGCTDARFMQQLEAMFEHPAQASSNGNGHAKNSVLLCGMETHICIYQTARSLVERGYAVHIATDATCSRRMDNHHVAQSLLKQLGAVVTSTEIALFDLLGRGDSADFKALIKLVR